LLLFFTGGLGVYVVGVGLVIKRSRVRLPAVYCRVSTWVGDRLCAGKPSPHVLTNHLGQISSIPPG